VDLKEFRICSRRCYSGRPFLPRHPSVQKPFVIWWDSGIHNNLSLDVNKHDFEELLDKKGKPTGIGKTAAGKKMKEGHPFWSVINIP
jgi:hypothetical protein